MNATEILQKYYDPESDTYRILVIHSIMVTQKALEIVKKHPELNADATFIEEAAMLHDIGAFMTDAPKIRCYGTHPYIHHGYLGHDLLVKEGYPKHALVCERHTGTGLTVKDIKKLDLDIPLRNMQPQSIEEQIICFADKFFTKSKPNEMLTVEKIEKKMAKFGNEKVETFRKWLQLFG